jgi:hypothetical protein
MREGTDLAGIDRQRDRPRIGAWIALDGWYGWGVLKDSSQPG